MKASAAMRRDALVRGRRPIHALKNHFFHRYSSGPGRADKGMKKGLAASAPFTPHSSSLCLENEPISISDLENKVLNKRARRETKPRNKRLSRVVSVWPFFMLQ